MALYILRLLLAVLQLNLALLLLGAAASRRCRIINPSSAVQFSLNFIILAIDSGDCVVLVLLNLTAAFDTAGSPAA